MQAESPGRMSCQTDLTPSTEKMDTHEKQSWTPTLNLWGEIVDTHR